MQPTKILGYALLAGGILIIIYSLFISFSIFTGRAEAPEVFEIKTPEISKTETSAKDLSTSAVEGVPPEMTEEMMQEALQEQLKGMLPIDYLPRLLNLISWSILAAIFIFGGAQISGVGIKLLKK